MENTIGNIAALKELITKKQFKIENLEAIFVSRNPVFFSLFLVEPLVDFGCSGDGVWVNSCCKVDFHKSPFPLSQLIRRIDPTYK